jgi:hypothetical protein
MRDYIDQAEERHPISFLNKVNLGHLLHRAAPQFTKPPTHTRCTMHT